MSQTLVVEGWREERRGRLLAAAARVFGGHSYEHASMDQIAAEAGVGKPTLYRYFPSKESLFAAVFVEALDDLEQRLAACLEDIAAGEDQLVGLIRQIVPTFRDHLVSLRMLGETAAVADQSRRRVFRERRARIAGYLETALARGVQAGAFRPV
jgi:TetR/AcrR family fatty acid metabolism transcriptional regulator